MEGTSGAVREKSKNAWMVARRKGEEGGQITQSERTQELEPHWIL